MDDRIERVIERMGQMFDAKRFSRTAGRIFGFLILADRPRTLDDIATELSVSRASVSTEARRLEALGLLERSARPGDRRDYYHVSSEHFRRMIQGELSRLGEMQRLFRDALDVPQMSATVRTRVSDFCDIHHFMQTKLTELLEQWTAHGCHPPVGQTKAR